MRVIQGWGRSAATAKAAGEHQFDVVGAAAYLVAAARRTSATLSHTRPGVTHRSCRTARTGDACGRTWCMTGRRPVQGQGVFGRRRPTRCGALSGRGAETVSEDENEDSDHAARTEEGSDQR